MSAASKLSATFEKFFAAERSAGVVLVLCAVVSVLIANSAAGGPYLQSWHAELGGMSVERWVNDGLMTFFFLLIGLELERELYVGELSDLRAATLPVVAAVGGVVAPALIHFSLNAGTPTQAGVGIPMATDIAFALGVIALVGSSVPASLKIFLTALAVIDDLIAIAVIAVFYASGVSWPYLAAAGGVLGALTVLNRLRVMALAPYLVGGLVVWFLMLRSGIHPTVTGVLLAFTIPFSGRPEDEQSPSHRLESVLQRPVAFAVLPIFALVNTAVVFDDTVVSGLASRNAIGVFAGLTIGKPLGIILFSWTAVSLGLCRLPDELGWKHVAGAGLLGGIGFTMSIFITNLAFPDDAMLIDSSKLAVFLASLVAGGVGYGWLRWGPSIEGTTDDEQAESFEQVP